MTDSEKNNEPDWLDPKNDRKTPYTDEEIEMFVDGFIEGHPEEFKQLESDDGPNTARVILRKRFREMDPRGPDYKGDIFDGIV